MPSTEAQAYASQHEADFLDHLCQLLAIPSISTLPSHEQECRRAAEWLAGYAKDIGLEHVEVILGPGHPLVYADWLHAGSAPTVLVYGHYDVQPVDPIEQWASAPFEPSVRDGYVFARGAVDDKGQVMALLEAAGSYLATDGGLPVNMRFLIEGEEESGGRHITSFLDSGDERLTADFAHVSDSSFFHLDTPSVETGLRGIVYTEVHAHAADRDLHSGEYGGVAPNPLVSLANLIARLRDGSGAITIPGFFDDVVTPPASVLNSWKELGVTAEDIAREIGARSIIGDPRFSPLERMWSRPTLDVHGIAGGFTAEGAKTVIPAEATAKISMRLAPNQKADTIFEVFRRAVEQLAPEDVEVEARLIHGDDPVVVPDDTAQVAAAMEAIRRVWGRSAVLTRTGGSIPVVGRLQRKGISTVLLGYGLPGDNLHAPNERFLLDQFHRGIQANIAFWELVGSKRVQ